jgi:SPP1 family predicted phage head-tail adaptor
MIVKNPSGVRYKTAPDYNTYVTFLQPNAGQAPDGTPNDPSVVKANVHANVAQWRGTERDKSDSRTAMSSYKIIIRYPKTYTIDSGMTIQFGSRLLNIESMSDPDGRQIEFHIWAWEENATS